MFRLVNDVYDGELHETAVFCLTETIKANLEVYFEEGYEQESEETLYTKVKVEKVYTLFPEKLLKEMKPAGVNPSTFIPKKIAQFMLLLKKEEEETPDIFLEYILDKMIEDYAQIGFSYATQNVIDKKPKLKKLLRMYAVKKLKIEDAKERNQFVKDQTLLLTDFSCLLGVEEPDDYSLVFWDWDYMFFDDWGFKNVIEQLAYGILGQRGYGLNYTKSIFTDVREPLPYILREKEIKKQE